MRNMRKRMSRRLLSVAAAVVVLAGLIVPVSSPSLRVNAAELPSYNAVSYITAAQADEKLETDALWSYSEKAIVKNPDTGKYETTGSFIAKNLTSYGGWMSATESIRTALPNMLWKWDEGNTGEGFAVYQNKIATYAGYGTGHAAALTFTAPEAGTVRLYDPDAGNIGPCTPKSTFWTLDSTGEAVGVAIYKNEEKIWPAEQDYYELTASSPTTAFPDLAGIEVKKGDKLYVMVVPVNNNFGYMQFAPQVDYTTAALPSYNAVSYITAAQADKKLETDALWSYSEKAIVKNANTGKYETTGSFIAKNLTSYGGWMSATGSIRTALSNMLWKWDGGTGEGFAVYQNKIVTYAGYGTGHAAALTFTAPEAGTVRLYDPDAGNIGPCTPKSTFWTLDSTGEAVGVAIYKNEEKIWPAEQDYYELTASSPTTAFPDLAGIEVKKGDKLYVMVIPVNNNFGYMQFAPQVDYTAYPEALPSYLAVDAVAAAQESGAFSADSAWTYTARRVEKDSASGLYLPSGEWFLPELEPGRSDSTGVNKLLTERQMLISGSNAGLSVYQGKVVTFTGYTYGGYSGALTFAAPYSGRIRLTDPSGAGIGVVKKGDPFFTMNDGAQKVGIAVYQNDQKIWPADTDYYEMTGDNWVDGVNTPGESNIAFPDLGDITVTRGDNIRIAVIPIGIHWGYFALAPRADYIAVDEEQPEPTVNPTYKAEEGVEAAVGAGTFDGSDWLLESRACYPDENGLNAPFGSWNEVPVTAGAISDKSIQAAVPSWLLYQGTNIGVAAYRKGVLLSTGSSGADYAVSLTYIAPKTGTVDLNDPQGGSFGTAGKGAPFWSLNETSKIAGLAIYKNDEKIWPENGGYYQLQGSWDASQKKDIDTKTSVPFPSLRDISVNAGDRLRICVIPVKNAWQFLWLSPTVTYTSVDEDSAPPQQPEPQKPAATYSASESVQSALESGSLGNSPWTLQAIRNVDSNIVGEDMILGSLFNETYPLMCKPMTFSSTLFPYTWWNVVNTQLAMTVDKTGRLMIPVGSRTTSGYTVWPAVSFEAPATGTIRLHAPEMSASISAAGTGAPYYTLQPNIDPDAGAKYPFLIYRNNTQIWPTDDSQAHTLTSTMRSIPFPDLTLQVYEGDMLRIITSGGTWGFVTMDPIVDYLSYSTQLRPSGDTIAWSFSSGSAPSFDWENEPDTEEPEMLPPYEGEEDGEAAGNTPAQGSEESTASAEDAAPAQKVKKTIVKTRVRKDTKGFPILGIAAGAGGLVLLGGGGFLVFRRLRKKKRASEEKSEVT